MCFKRKTKLLTIATIDIGSNTSLLLIARFPDCHLQGQPDVLVDQIFFTRLAEGLSQKRKIKNSALKRQEVFFQKAQDLIHHYSVDTVKCVATASARLAQNADELMELAKRYGFFIDIISAEKEAQISRQGALFGLSSIVSKQTVVLDIGGASTEISTETQFFSLNMGSVSLTEKLLHQDPPSQIELERLKQYVLKEIKSLPEEVFHENFVLVATAGIPTTLMALEKKQNEVAKIHGNILDIHQIQQWFENLSRLNVVKRKHLPAMPVYRADVIIAGISVLKETMRYFKWKKCVVSTTGLRYGLLYS